MKRRSILLAALGSVLFSSCLKQPDLDQLTNNLVVATNIDDEADLSSFSTYYISDSVAYLANGPTDTIISNSNVQQLVDAVKSNMNARGYTFVAKGSNPDMGINMGIIKNTSATIIYPGWWWGYPGWWDPWYWGWYYPYYYPWSVTYVVTTGTILIDLVNRKNAQADGKLSILWSAVLGGAVASDVNTNVQLGVNAINQAFAQTPELAR